MHKFLSQEFYASLRPFVQFLWVELIEITNDVDAMEFLLVISFGFIVSFR